MEVRVLRDACCGQDDQIGPLEANYSFGPDATLSEFVQAVVGSNFLQYSSSHTILTAFIDGTPLVKVPSAYYLPGRAPDFSIPPDTRLSPLVSGKTVEFRFLGADIRRQ